MMTLGVWLVLLAVAVGAGLLGSVAGFGSVLLLMPVCSYAFGVEKTVPILTVAALLGNLSRAAYTWRETDWTTLRLYLLGGVPGAVAGARLFSTADAGAIQRIIGLLVLLSVPARRMLFSETIRIPSGGFVALGAVIGFLSGFAGAVGPLNVPFFLAHGLMKGAYIATDAFASAAIHLTKSAVYGRFAVLDVQSVGIGSILGFGLLAGAWIGRRVIDCLDTPAFVLIVEILMVVSALTMIAGI